MQTTLISDQKDKTFVAILETGDEIIKELTEFARAQNLRAAHFTAIGALYDVTLGYFDWEKKDYQRLPFQEQMEILSLIGDITLNESGDEPKVHAHVVLGREDGTVRGGHLLKGYIRPTLEVMLTESPKSLGRRFDPQSGLALIDLTQEHATAV